MWLGRNNYVSVRSGYFYDNYNDTGVSQTTSYTYRNSTAGVPGVPANLQGGLGTSNTPRVEISYKDKTTQGFFQLDYNHAFTAAGSHLLKGGWGIRRSVNDVENAYPGGYVYLFWGQSVRSGATGQTGTGTYGYYQVNDLATRGAVNANIQNLYVQDSWTVTPRLTLNLGLRTENEKIPTFRPDIAQYAFQFGFGDKLAPRLGATFDVKGDGRMKAFASWGRYYDWTKYEIARGSFGGDLWHIFYRCLDTLDLGSLNLSNMPGKDLWGGPLGYQRFSSNGYREHGSQHQADVSEQLQCRARYSAQCHHDARGSRRPQRSWPDDRGHRRGGYQRQQSVRDWKPWRRAKHRIRGVISRRVAQFQHAEGDADV